MSDDSWEQVMRTIAATDGAWKDKAAIEKAEQCAAIVDSSAATNRKPPESERSYVPDPARAFTHDSSMTWGHKIPTLLKQASSRATGTRKSAMDELIRLGQIADRTGRGEINRPS